MTSFLRTMRCPVALLTLLVALSACYDESSKLPGKETPSGSESVADRQSSAKAAANGGVAVEPPSETLRAQWVATIKLVTRRLGTPGAQMTADQRPGAGTWRAAELEKVKEVLTECCRSDAKNCGNCLEPIARQRLPAEELWPLIGQFLGPLRSHAQLGLMALGSPLFAHPDGRVRDRIYRMAVAGGISRRGQPDDEHRRASTVPLVPRVGERTWLVVEQLSPCPNVAGSVKGPDRSGRIDLVITDSCSQADWEETTKAFPPRATRAVWAVEIEAMPMAGINLWMAGGKDALLRAIPGREAASSEPKSP